MIDKYINFSTNINNGGIGSGIVRIHKRPIRFNEYKKFKTKDLNKMIYV